MILTFLTIPIRSVLLYHASAKFNFSLMVILLHFITRKTIHNWDYRIFRRALWTFWFILSIHPKNYTILPNNAGAFLFVGQFLCNFLYETPLGQIDETKE